jgi:hypothetical protein
MPDVAQSLVPWRTLLPGVSLWALALYLPLSLPLARLEEALTEGPLDQAGQQLVLVVSSLLLALAVGLVADLALCLALGPSWASSLGLLAVLGGLPALLAGRRS